MSSEVYFYINIAACVLSLITLVFLYVVQRLNSNPGFDFYFHKFLINKIKKNGLYKVGEIDRTIKKSSPYYPFFLHHLTSKVPKKYLSFFYSRFNYILHILFGLILFLFAHHFGLALEKAALLTSLYFCSPAFHSPISIGPRVTTFTPRLLGEFFGLFYFIFLYQFELNHDFLLIPLVVLSASLMIVTSKFSRQALLFGTFILSCLFSNIFLFIIMLLGFILAFCSNKWEVYSSLRSQINHLKSYFWRNLRGGMYVSDRNSFIKFLQLLRKKDFNGFAKHLFMCNSWTSTFFKLPIFYGALYALFVRVFSHHHFDIIDLFFLTSALLFILVSLRPLLFLGEAERYLNYFIPFILLESYRLPSSYFNFLVLCTCFFSVLYIIITILYGRSDRSRVFRNDQVIAMLQAIKDPLNIATIPYHQVGGWRILSDTIHNWLYNGMMDLIDKEKLNSFEIKYPILNLDLISEIIAEYNLDLVVIEDTLYRDYTKENEITIPGFSILNYGSSWILSRSSLSDFFRK